MWWKNGDECKMSEDLEEAGWYLLIAVFVMLWMLMMMVFD
tara:strand:+ start:13 stop:132 length:120 start_codon:yes stop_codon:yes gene_type:complete